MASYLSSVVLEFAEEDLSDVTPTWVNVTSDLMDCEWWAGIDRESDDPQPGGATIRLKNTNRRWEPDHAAGQFYPNVTTHRRFRLTLNDGLGAVQEGLWYVTEIGIDYPAGTAYSEVTFTCADGDEVLALDDLPGLDPPDATSYADVVNFDGPWGYWRLGERQGTRARARLVFDRFDWVWKRGNFRRRKIKKRQGTRYSTRGEAGAVSGPAGVYKNNPLLGQPGLILGDMDTSVEFDEESSHYMRVPVDQSDTIDGNKISVECWFDVTSAEDQTLVAGPWSTAAGAPVWAITWEIGVPNFLRFRVRFTDGTTLSVVTDQAAAGTHHVLGTWNGTTLRISLDGVEEQEKTTGSGQLRVGDADGFIHIGQNSNGADFADAIIDEVAIYEHALSPARVAAHYTAGSDRGWPEQTAGERIADIATHALWSEAGIQTTGRDVQPEMKIGQDKLGEISELAHAEGPKTMFFFNGSGNPVYLGHEWQATSASYNTVQATLGGESDEIGYQALEPVYDNETYSAVTVSHESGELVELDTGAVPRRSNTEWTDVLLMHHIEVESLANHILDFYEQPQMRFATVELNGADPQRLNHILRRDIGHLVRVRALGENPIDRVTHIIGKRKRLDVSKHLTCQWTLARGFNAADGFNKAGIVGFSEAGVTTVAG